MTIEPELPRLEIEEATDFYVRVVAEPLQRGFGTTLGAALRRTLLSALPGASVVAVRVDQVQHEFSTIPHVTEDTTELLLNVRAIRLKALSDRPAIRGQLEGPISFGFNINDENDRPILFDDTVRPFMLEFMAKRINVQLARLKERNGNAFMFVDEPGLQFLFSAMSGYDDMKAKKEMDLFFSQVDRPRGIHLCGNPDWDFLLGLDMDILSLDIYTNSEIFAPYASSIQRFLDKGGVIVWGIVPTGVESFEKENVPSLIQRLEDTWQVLTKKGIDRTVLLEKSLLSPATCCLVNPDREKTVEKAFESITRLSRMLREKYRIDD